jgi:hypothetical protein
MPNPTVVDFSSTIAQSTSTSVGGHSVASLVGDIIYATAFIPSSAAQVSSMSGGGVATWHQRLAQTHGMEVWWGAVTTPQANTIVTFNYTGGVGVNNEPAWLLIRGAGSVLAPFDPSVTLPASPTGNTATYTTTNPPSMLIWGGFNTSTGTPATPSGWTLSVNINWFNIASTKLCTLLQSGAVTGLTATGTGAAFVLADAIAAPILVDAVEPATATDTTDAISDYLITVTETAAAADTVSAAVNIEVSVNESAPVTDTLETQSDYQISHTESAPAQDFLVTYAAGGGGGGAAGLFGDGEDGQPGQLNGDGGFGGFGDANQTARQLTPGADGNDGIEWDSISIGSGSGGAGGSYNDSGIGQDGGSGGFLGGGGGGGGGGVMGGGQGGLGGNGVIYIQYISSVTATLVQQTLTETDITPYVVPADWSNTNLIILIGAGGCGEDGSIFIGGRGGFGGDCIGVENYNGFSPGEEVPFEITTALIACESPDPVPGTGFGSGVAAAGANGGGGGGGGSAGFAGGFNFVGGPGGPGGILHGLHFIQTATITEEAAPQDTAAYSFTLAPLPPPPPPPRPPIRSTNIPSATAQQPYPPVPTNMDHALAWNAQIARTLNLVLSGKMNNTLAKFTLTPNSTTTILRMTQIGAHSAITLTPLTANAAAEKFWISDQKQGEATINHANSATTDRTYSVMVMA